MKQKIRFSIFTGAPARAVGLALGLGFGFAACAAWDFPTPGSPAAGYKIVHEVRSGYQRI
jgi:hypothetical protein